MTSKAPIPPDLKTFFELQVAKKLFEDNFFPYASQVPEDGYNALDLCDQVFQIASAQGYRDFGSLYRSQLIDALEGLISTYKDICNRHAILAAKYPDVKFSILNGWRKYRIYTDGISGNILKVTAEVRVASGRTSVEVQNESIVGVTVYLVDKYNYNYRNETLQEWVIQNNMIVWRDLIQGNGFLNFILTKERTALTPMRVVLSTSTRQIVAPIPPCPAPLPPGPFPPPPPGPHPPPYYPPCPPGPIPPPPYPPVFPPPFPPVETMLIKQVVAERTVGGISEGSILPAGLTFTQFVEWLLHGKAEPEPDVLYYAAVPLTPSPQAEDIVAMTSMQLTESALQQTGGVKVNFATDYTTIFLAVPATYRSKIAWFESDGTTSLSPVEPYSVTINGVEYLAYHWDTEFLGPQSIVLKHT